MSHNDHLYVVDHVEGVLQVVLGSLHYQLGHSPADAWRWKGLEQGALGGNREIAGDRRKGAGST